MIKLPGKAGYIGFAQPVPKRTRRIGVSGAEGLHFSTVVPSDQKLPPADVF